MAQAWSVTNKSRRSFKTPKRVSISVSESVSQSFVLSKFALRSSSSAYVPPMPSARASVRTISTSPAFWTISVNSVWVILNGFLLMDGGCWNFWFGSNVAVSHALVLQCLEDVPFFVDEDEVSFAEKFQDELEVAFMRLEVNATILSNSCCSMFTSQVFRRCLRKAMPEGGRVMRVVHRVCCQVQSSASFQDQSDWGGVGFVQL